VSNDIPTRQHQRTETEDIHAGLSTVPWLFMNISVWLIKWR